MICSYSFFNQMLIIEKFFFLKLGAYCYFLISYFEKSAVKKSIL